MSAYVTVADLMEELSAFPENTMVVLARDEEGNNFSPLSDLGPAVYVPDSPYSGEAYDPREVGEFKDAQHVVVLWPMN